jgi:two-component sensor histidine kinase
MEFVRKISAVRRHPWHGYAAATLIVVLAFALRNAFGQQDDPSVPFITFFPAILLTALLSGTAVATVVAILGGFLALYFFIPPYYALLPASWWGVVVMVLYALTVAILIVVVHYLNRALDELAQERDHSAALFRELQHRVANNMQFAAALLTLQKRRVGDGPAAEILEQTRARFEAMSRVHRRLYDPLAAEKPLGEYLEGLCREIVESSGARNIVCVAQISSDIKLDLQKLLTLSLVASELITNSLKHAFSEDGGTISINLERAERQIALTIADNGRGLPQGIEAREKGLGMRVLDGLAAQLGGSLDFSSGRGTTARLMFPD